MHHFPIILADDAGKIVAFVIFAVIYGIGALASMVKKANEQAKMRAAKGPGVANTPALRPPPMPARRAAPASVKMAQPPARRVQRDGFAPSSAQRAAALQQMAARSQTATSQVRAPQVKARTPAVVARPAPAAKPPTTPRAAAPVAAVSAIARPGGANAVTIRRWLRPDTMRKQFILTELLQPPMALRAPREQQ